MPRPPGHLAGAKIALYYLNKEIFGSKNESGCQYAGQNPASSVYGIPDGVIPAALTLKCLVMELL